jgi:alkane 1-monooxygenase
MAIFASTSGWRGVVVYASSCALVAFSIQLVTYMQHWGLGDDSCIDAKARGFGWESDCRFQAWVTMGLSLHYTHHQRGALPYYRLHLASDSPRLPMGYVLLMFVAFLPPLWRRLMTPALKYWKSQPSSPVSGGRKLSCVALYK